MPYTRSAGMYIGGQDKTVAGSHMQPTPIRYTPRFDYLGDKTFNQLNLKIHQSYQRPGPSTRDRTLTIPGRAGEWDFGADIGPMPFDLPVTTINQDPASLQQTIRALQAHLFDSNGNPKTLKLMFYDEPDVYYNVRFSGKWPISRIVGVGQFSLPLTAFDPDGQLIAENKDINWNSQSITWQMANIKWGSRGGEEQFFASPGYYYAWSNGSKIARPTITVTGSADRLNLSVNDQTLSFDSFTNSTIVIDGLSYAVIKDGASNLSLVTGSLADFHLIPGANLIWVSGGNLDVTLSVVLRDRYM